MSLSSVIPRPASRASLWMAVIGVLLAWGRAPAAPAGGAQMAGAGPARRVACPSVEFEKFFAAFSEDAATQEAFTRSPLRKRFVDAAADPEPTTVERMLARSEINFPVLPLAADRARRGQRLRLSAGGRDRREVVLLVPDTGQQVVYRFAKDACWELVEIDDQSI